LFNRNYATLEAELGETITSNNTIYLNNTYTITDSATNALSYNGKKFIANRTDINLYINQENGLQLLEITDSDNTSTESITWELNG
jgi:predicted transcriptional regulator